MPLRFIIASLVCLMILSDCCTIQQSEGVSPADPPVSGPPGASVRDTTSGARDEFSAVESRPAVTWADSVLGSLSLREKAAQMIVPFTWSRSDSSHLAQLKSLIRREKVGGFIISTGTAADASKLIDSLQSYSTIPLLISADFESGVATRLSGGTEFPSNMALGATRNPLLAYRMGFAVAEEGRLLGVHQNYAPVADVNNNAENPIINMRSYGEDPAIVRNMSDAFLQGLQDGGMIATAKHFPGHGDTEVDSHTDLPILDFDTARLDSIELDPFRSAVEHGVESVMIAHVAVPALDQEARLPATLSPRIVDSLLRGRFGFDGLIVTDALNMRALMKKYSTGEAAVRAVKAGNDILLMPTSESAAIDSVVTAVERGEITRERLDRSVRRLLVLKDRLIRKDSHSGDSGRAGLESLVRRHQIIAEEIARRSITVARNRENILPLRGTASKKYYCLGLVQNGNREAAESFIDELDHRKISLSSAVVEKTASHSMMRRLLKKIGKSDEVIVAAFTRVIGGKNEVSLSEDQRYLLKKLALLKKPLVFISFGSPYVCATLPSAQAILLAYCDARVSVQAAVEVLFADISPGGKLPVSIAGIADCGTGVSYPAREPGDKEVLRPAVQDDPMRSIDSLIQSRILDHAFPGAVLLVQENGLRRHLRAYGRHTYEETASPMTVETMFDLASVSKVISTTSCAMKLHEEGLLHLDSTVGHYLPAFARNGKEKITIRNLLLHNSGLVPFRLYYSFCRDERELIDTLFGERLMYKTGTRTVYSDLGMITLAKVIESITGRGLDAYADETFFRPLGLRRTMYAPPESLRNECAPTELDTTWRMRLVQGTVHDEAAALLKGVAGHAGLFSTAPDLAVILQMLLNGGTYNGRRYLKPETIALFTRKQSTGSSRALGWDTPSPRGSSAGIHFSPNSFGHTGFTGTSVWIDPVKKIFVIFLTNRVHPTRQNTKLLPFRSILHNEILRILLGK